MADPTAGPYASCRAMRSGAEALLERCRREGSIRPDLELTELLMLVHGIAWASEQVTGAGEHVDRLLLLLIEGLRRQPA